MPAAWYALHVKPHKEQWVDDLLEARRVEHFYPVLQVKPVNPRSRKQRPYFPGYLFVRVDLEVAGSDAFRWLQGSYGLVEFGGRAPSVPEQMIQAIRQRLCEAQLSRPTFQAGERVRIVHGPFEGYEAIFDLELTGKDRVQLLLTFLRDRPKRLQIAASEIAKLRK
ncbi:MAG: transcription termination/antitermination protein NusG [Candidatus Promineifilaceae bacterium]